MSRCAESLGRAELGTPKKWTREAACWTTARTDAPSAEIMPPRQCPVEADEVKSCPAHIPSTFGPNQSAETGLFQPRGGSRTDNIRGWKSEGESRKREGTNALPQSPRERHLSTDSWTECCASS